MARRGGFRFAETVLFSWIPCFLLVSRRSVHHSAKNAPLLSIRAFDTAENEFLQVRLLFLFENASKCMTEVSENDKIMRYQPRGAFPDELI